MQDRDQQTNADSVTIPMRNAVVWPMDGRKRLSIQKSVSMATHTELQESGADAASESAKSTGQISSTSLDEEIRKLAREYCFSADSAFNPSYYAAHSRSEHSFGKHEFSETDFQEHHKLQEFPRAHVILDTDYRDRSMRSNAKKRKMKVPLLTVDDETAEVRKAGLIETASHARILLRISEEGDEDSPSKTEDAPEMFSLHSASTSASLPAVTEECHRQEIAGAIWHQPPIPSQKFRRRSVDSSTEVMLSEKARESLKRVMSDKPSFTELVKFHIGEDPLTTRRIEPAELTTPHRKESRKLHSSSKHGRRRSRKSRGSVKSLGMEPSDLQLPDDDAMETALVPHDKDDIKTHRYERRFSADGPLEMKSPGAGHAKRAIIHNSEKRNSVYSGKRDSIPDHGELDDEITPLDEVFEQGRSRKKARQEQTEHTFKTRVKLEPHELFVELDELYVPCSPEGEMEWRETARWIKYEEDVEFGAEKWGKPHVPSLSFHSLLELKRGLENGSVMLDLHVESIFGIAEAIVEGMYISDQIRKDDRPFVLRALLLPHRHVNESTAMRLKRQETMNSLDFYFYRQQSVISPLSVASFGNSDRTTSVHGVLRPKSVAFMANNHSNGYVGAGGKAPDTNLVRRKLTQVQVPANALSVPFMTEPPEQAKSPEDDFFHTSKESLRKFCLRCCRTKSKKKKRQEIQSEIMKRIEKDTEGAIVLVGAVNFLEKPTFCLVRLSESLQLPGVTEIPIPVRFVFILLGPLNAGMDYHEVGRSISTLLSCQRFNHAAYKSGTKGELLYSINEFLDDSIVLPPGKWEDRMLLSFEQIKMKSDFIRERRKALTQLPSEWDEMMREQLIMWQQDPLRRTGQIFGGMKREVSRRIPYFIKDYTDAIDSKCVSSILFIFLSCFIPALTFGAILGTKTKGTVGIKETLLATSFGGMIFATLSAQPVMLIGISGPMLIFEESLFKFCAARGLDFLVARVWVAVWCLVLCVVTLALEGSFMIRYITRFSDDILSALMSVIFISECIIFLTTIFELHPLMPLNEYCGQLEPNNSIPFLNRTTKEYSRAAVYTIQHYTGNSLPNTALLSGILALGTFLVAFLMRGLRTSRFFGRHIRRALGDFGVSLAVVFMVLLDKFALRDSGITSQLRVGAGVAPTNPDRPWLVWALGAPPWVYVGAFLPGVLLFLVLFVETEVGEMEMARKEHHLRRGTGYHWDLLLLGVMLVPCAMLGLPWLCPVPVRSAAHLHSLTQYKLGAPGQKPAVSHVVEQRVTGLVLHVLIGLTLFGTQVLHTIPVSVLMGVFLYLGVMNMYGVQMLSRAVLFFVPVKYHPTAPYCLRVRTWRMHLYTGIQLLCFTFVCAIKSVKLTSFAFPFAIMLTVLFRHLVLPWIFTEVELYALDAEEEPTEELDFYEGSRLPV